MNINKNNYLHLSPLPILQDEYQNFQLLESFEILLYSK